MLQEILKGKGVSGEILGSTYGGWRFNFVNSSYQGSAAPNPSVTGTYAQWIPGLPVTVPLTYVTRHLTAAEALPLAGNSQQLMTQPFFNPPPAGKTHGELLAQAFPARTNAAGRNSVGVFEDQGEEGEVYNFDMVILKNNWFSTETNEKRWLHSDIRDVGYPYTYKVYDKFKELGKLDQ